MVVHCTTVQARVGGGRESWLCASPSSVGPCSSISAKRGRLSSIPFSSSSREPEKGGILHEQSLQQPGPPPPFLFFLQVFDRPSLPPSLDSPCPNFVAASTFIPRPTYRPPLMMTFHFTKFHHRLDAHGVLGTTTLYVYVLFLGSTCYFPSPRVYEGALTKSWYTCSIITHCDASLSPPSLSIGKYVQTSVEGGGSYGSAGNEADG